MKHLSFYGVYIPRALILDEREGPLVLSAFFYGGFIGHFWRRLPFAGQGYAVCIHHTDILIWYLQFCLSWVHYDHDLSAIEFPPAVVLDEVIGACTGGQNAGIVPEIKFLVHKVEPADRGWSVVPGELGFKDLVVPLEDSVDLGDEQRLIPAIDPLSFPIACIPAVIVAVFLVPPTKKFLSAGEAYKGREVWVKSTHNCKSASYPF